MGDLPRTYIFSDFAISFVPSTVDNIRVPKSRGAVVSSGTPVPHANRPSEVRIAAELIEHKRLK